MTAQPAVMHEAVAALRKQVRALLSDLDTGEKPAPDFVLLRGDGDPGPVWQPHRKWVIRVIEDGDPDGHVYATTPADLPGDYTAMDTTQARSLAMALLAAADWADGVSRPRPRRGSRPSAEPVMTKTFVCGRR